MLEPREADIPALFLVFIVLPLLAYVLLGKWSEASKKSERVSLLAQLASEEALGAEAMAVPDIIPPVLSSKNNVHACARCSRPAISRCSRCKSVRYCSGKCQIIHWREVHRQTCLPHLLWLSHMELDRELYSNNINGNIPDELGSLNNL